MRFLSADPLSMPGRSLHRYFQLVLNATKVRVYIEIPKSSAHDIRRKATNILCTSQSGFNRKMTEETDHEYVEL